MKENIDPGMHTAEHILNQTMIRLFACKRCFSAHIEKKKSKCDYYFDRNLTAEELLKLEAGVNEALKSNLPVTEEIVTLEEAMKNFDLKRVPDGQMKIRIIRIGDYDATTCIGNHVHNTKQIGGFKIISTDCNEGILRIRYKLENYKF